jgi:hypothetical protein
MMKTAIANAVRRAAKPYSRAMRPFRHWRAINRATRYNYRDAAGLPAKFEAPAASALRSFFAERKEGRGIHKWDHYFDIYEGHFRRFRGKKIRLLEIGVYAGGSLDMWRDYFGPDVEIYGVDIEPSLRNLEKDGVKIFIGDQADRKFWREFREQVGSVDIVIDDGGHFPQQQIVSVEELLPIVRPGGVYVCEDVHGEFQRFLSYVCGLGHKLNAWDHSEDCECSQFQAAVASIHLYPFVTVIEKNEAAKPRLVSERHGSLWPQGPGGVKSPKWVTRALRSLE